jgi:glycosyltransferase involved in cell wall biosynthesis
MVDAPLRILHVIDTLGLGGAQRHLLWLAESLRTRGHRCPVVTSGPTPDGGGPDIVSLARDPISHGVPLRFTARSIRFLAEHPVDLVHAHLHSASVAAAAAAAVHRLPVVVTHHSDWEWQPAHHRALGGWASRRARPAITVARALRARLAERNLPTVLIPNGVPLPAEPPDDDTRTGGRRLLGIPPTAFVVGFTGRFVEDKNPLLFVDMAARVAAVDGSAHFLMAGDGPLRAAVGERVARHGLSSRFTLAGVRGDVETLYGLTDVTVLPSRREACPLVPLEAMAAGRPVVGTAVGDVPEQIDHGVSGYVVPAGDAASLASAVLVLADPERRLRFGRAGRERVARHYSLGRMVDRTLEVYEAALLRQRSETLSPYRPMQGAPDS